MQGKSLRLLGQRLRVTLMALASGLALAGGLAAPVAGQVINGNQLPNPRLTVLTPAGGKVGSTFEVTFAGSELDQPQALIFSHAGIKAEPIIPDPPKPDPKAKPDPKKPPAPPPPITKFKVSIAGNTPVGSYDVRFVNKFGVSNPRIFAVGDLNEVTEKEPNNDVEPATRIDIGTTVNGVISAPTDVDYFVFTGKKGQRILIACMTAGIDSKLHPELWLYDSKGRQLGYHRPLPGNDGVFDFIFPDDGDYYLRLNQFTYTAGGADYFYRLSVSSGPWIDAIFPPMVEPGKPSQVTLFGRNLPGGKPDPAAVLDGRALDKLVVTVTAPKDPQALARLDFSGVVSPLSGLLDGFTYRLAGPNGLSNPQMLTFAQAPVILENDNNDTPETAQLITVPAEIAGRIDKARDRDWYVFSAKKGEVYIIDLFSHRLGAPTDMYISLRNLEKKQNFTIPDDTTEALSTKGFYSANKDPAPFRFVVPEDGKYHMLVASHVGDLSTDPRHMYRLSIAPERPDFRLVVMPPDDFRPDSLTLGKGGLQNFLVFAQRQDGFKGEITLSVEGLPTGVACPPHVLAGNQKQGLLVLSAAEDAPEFTGAIKVTGTAIINGQKVVREARPATITWAVQPQQNIPTVTRLDRMLMIAVRDKAPFRLTATKDTFVASLGDKVNIPLKVVRHDPEFKAAVQLQPTPGDLPPNLNFANITLAPGKDEQPLVLTIAPNANPGKYTLVFRSFAPVATNPKAKPVNAVMPSSAVQLTILPKQVANLSVDNANPTVKLGNQTVILVKVARLYDFSDSFKVELVLPPNAKALSADPIVIPAGQNEAKLTLRVPANAPPGNLQNLTIRAVAVVNGNVTLTHETKINVNVVK